MSVTFIRHAQSTWNAYGDRSRNVGLSEHGIKQANNLDGEYDLVILSNLRRTKETLENSNIKYKTLYITPLCREILSGTEGDYLEDEEIYFESDYQIQNRIYNLYSYLLDCKKQHKNICVITHYCFFNRIFNRILNNCEKHVINL